MINSGSSRLPDFFYLLLKWWKLILTIVVLSVVIVGAVVYFKPDKYLSTATALPAPPYANDKAAVFGENVQLLYPGIGIPDDLDRIVGTARLDTVYFYLVDQFNLWDHYKIPKDNEARQNCVTRLKADIKVFKSDYGELKIKAWDTDKNLAAQLANALMAKLQQLHQGVQNASNISVLTALKKGRDTIQKDMDSIGAELKIMDPAMGNADEKKSEIFMGISRREVLSEQLKKYEKLINEYELLVNVNPAALIIVETARPASWPDKPLRIKAIVAAAFISFILALLIALLMERRTFLQSDSRIKKY